MMPPDSAYPRTFAEFIKRFDTEEKCIAYVELIRWPNGFVCPFCGVIGDPYASGTPCSASCRRSSAIGTGRDAIVKDAREALGELARLARGEEA